MRIYLIRCLALVAVIAVLWLFGPKAWVVLSAQVGGADAVTVDLDRVGPGLAPKWLHADPALFRAVLEEIAPCVDRRVRADDEAELRELSGILRRASWVKNVRLQPDAERGFRLALELRRPVLEVVPEGPAAGEVRAVYVTAAGICLHHSEHELAARLPKCRLLSGPTPGSLPLFELGKPHPDPRVLAAAAVAAEWRDDLAPKVENAPQLVEVDASNLHYRLLADRRTSQVRIEVGRRGGGTTRLDYGLPPGQPLPRVAVADKAAVLQQILGRHPGLKGVKQADLRFVNTWESWLRLDTLGNSGAPNGQQR